MAKSALRVASQDDQADDAELDTKGTDSNGKPVPAPQPSPPPPRDSKDSK